jgi:opacity protein-like surface antigen
MPPNKMSWSAFIVGGCYQFILLNLDESNTRLAIRRSKRQPLRGMNAMRKCAIIFTVAVTTSPAFAADMAFKAPPPPIVPFGNDILKANNQISVDFIVTNFNFKEYNDFTRTPFQPTDSAGVADTEKGWVPGVSATGSVMTDVFGIHNVYFSARFSYLNGHTDYWNPTITQNDPATVNKWDFRLGKGFDFSPNTMVTPYFGAGTSWWKRTIVAQAQEDYFHAYAGGGLLLQWAPFSRLVLSANGLIGSTFASEMSASPIDSGPAFTPFNVSLGSSLIYMLGGSADYAFTDHLHANVGIEYVNFKYGESDYASAGVLGPVYEPSSRTSNVTVSAGLGWSFGGQ